MRGYLASALVMGWLVALQRRLGYLKAFDSKYGLNGRQLPRR